MGFLLSNYQKRKSICKNGTSSIKKNMWGTQIGKTIRNNTIAKTT